MEHAFSISVGIIAVGISVIIVNNSWTYIRYFGGKNRYYNYAIVMLCYVFPTYFINFNGYSIFRAELFIM